MTILAALSLAASVLSALCLIVNFAVFRDLPSALSSEAGTVVSVIIPARDEERTVEQAVRSHLRSEGAALEVIVVDDRSTDGTAAILRRLAREDPRVQVISGVEPPDGWLGKPHALWQGAFAARGQWLLFADADVVYAPKTVGQALAFAGRDGADFLALLPRLEARSFWEAVLMPQLYVSLFLGPGFLMQTPRIRRWSIGAGAGNLVRRDVYAAVGGHAAIPAAVIDDVRLAALVKRAGYRVRAVAAFDGVSVRMYGGFSEIVEGFTKNIAYATASPAALACALALFLILAAGPYVVLALYPRDLAARLCLAALGLTLVARFAVDIRTRSRWWSGFFHPIMVAVWTWIGARSIARRVIGRRIDWRGRTAPASIAR